jgi:XTP/dITP diphosphohydrolase
MPGVLSARWSGPPKDDDRNNRLLLAQLADVPDARRGAEFRCAVAFCHDDGAGGLLEHVVEGVMPGRVIRELRGTGGFGYDVLFVPDEQDGSLTSAEMDAAEKDAISHRGKALREIAPVVVEVLGGGA